MQRTSRQVNVSTKTELNNALKYINILIHYGMLAILCICNSIMLRTLIVSNGVYYNSIDTLFQECSSMHTYVRACALVSICVLYRCICLRVRVRVRVSVYCCAFVYIHAYNYVCTRYRAF